MGLILPGGENLLDVLELRPLLSISARRSASIESSLYKALYDLIGFGRLEIQKFGKSGRFSLPGEMRPISAEVSQG